MDQNKKPFAGISKQAVPQNRQQAEESAELAELARDRQRIEERETRRSNKVAEILGKAKFWVTDWTTPELFINGAQYSISEYYPELKIAVDKFYDEVEYDSRLCKEKKEKLNAIGIRYGFLTPEMRLADLLDQITDQKK